jgi:hypothetical protein
LSQFLFFHPEITLMQTLDNLCIFSDFLSFISPIFISLSYYSNMLGSMKI